MLGCAGGLKVLLRSVLREVPTSAGCQSHKLPEGVVRVRLPLSRKARHTCLYGFERDCSSSSSSSCSSSSSGSSRRLKALE